MRSTDVVEGSGGESSPALVAATLGMSAGRRDGAAAGWLARLMAGVRERLLPDVRVGSVAELTPSVLAARGIEAVLVDLDDTLVPADGSEPVEGAVAWFAELAAAGIRVGILSNGERDRVGRFAHQVGVPALALAGKPLPRAFRRGLALVGEPAPAHTAMIGDQLFTDVLGGRRAGLVTVLVTPLSQGKLPHTRLARRVETMILKES